MPTLCFGPTLSPTPVSPELWEVLVQATAWRDRSHGAFDPTVGVFTDLWRKSRQTSACLLQDSL